jgi:hypothetical protein
MDTLEEIAPAFVALAHQIVWATAATTDPGGWPSTRILHPVWQWDGVSLTGWIATSPLSPKAADLAGAPRMSLTYWRPNQDTCTARCLAAWESTAEERAAGWARFRDAPAPLGYDPKLIPGWTSPDAPTFGILRLEPVALRLMEGTRMAGGSGALLTWRAAPPAGA